MTEHDLDVVNAMERFGGSFVCSLATCFRHADQLNFQKLKKTFINYWNEYDRKFVSKTEHKGREIIEDIIDD